MKSKKKKNQLKHLLLYLFVCCKTNRQFCDWVSNNCRILLKNTDSCMSFKSFLSRVKGKI